MRPRRAACGSALRVKAYTTTFAIEKSILDTRIGLQAFSKEKTAILTWGSLLTERFQRPAMDVRSQFGRPTVGCQFANIGQKCAQLKDGFIPDPAPLDALQFRPRTGSGHFYRPIFRFVRSGLTHPIVFGQAGL